MSEIHIVVTMDCERPTSDTHAAASGPPNLEKAEIWTRAYAEIAAEFGFPVTYFVHPEVAVAQADLFRELEAVGHCLGLHLHAWRFDARFQCEFGGLNEAQSRTMLAEASQMWRQAFGTDPLYFRQGTLSANDSLFRALADLGFRGGSVSLPGRVFPDKHAVWAGAPLDPHRGHAIFRLLEGDLAFANMPISVDTSELHHRDGRQFYWDLRPDFDGLDYTAMARNIVAQLQERSPAVPCINMLTHNDHDFADPEGRVCRNFRNVLTEFTAACNEAGITPVGATLANICDRVLAEPVKSAEFDPSGGRVFLDVDDRPR
jgi:peptidoglycan/xylan/chitin deacetylase (PgdA/CDA1 family)